MAQSKEEALGWPTDNSPDQKPAWSSVATDENLNIWKAEMKSEEKEMWPSSSTIKR